MGENTLYSPPSLLAQLGFQKIKSISFKGQRFLILLWGGGVIRVLVTWAAREPCVELLPRELADWVTYLPAISTEPTFGLLSKLSLQILPTDLCVAEG